MSVSLFYSVHPHQLDQIAEAFVVLHPGDRGIAEKGIKQALLPKEQLNLLPPFLSH